MPQPRYRPPEPFRCEVRAAGETTYLELHGELDLDTVAHAERALTEVREAGHDSVVLDLRQLTFIDSTGLRLVLEWDAAARGNGFRFAVIPGDGPVLRLFRLAGVEDRITRADA